ncbi:MAG: FAD-binding oxidoreductase [Pseudomonadota bacterium]|nr:FAD-binding oxidoreductase [Pseudomonadota bacterium]
MPQTNYLSAEYDVLIVGGGIAGATLGAEIAGSARTLLIETEDLCGYHSTGRSAAFWLESYGGPIVAQLTAASRPILKRGGFLRRRGALHVSPTRDFEVPEGVETREVTREELERRVPGIRPQWQHALMEPGCADIDVARLHSDALARYRRAGGELRTRSMLRAARFAAGRWSVELADGATVTASILVNAAGAWADSVASAAGVQPLGIVPKRRTMVQLRVGRTGLRTLPLVSDAAGTFYFKGEGDRSIWLSPHDEIDSDPCDAAPEEIDVATAIARFEQVVDWPVERVERSWAGLRSFAPDRIPVYGFAADSPRFFWYAGQGGFGIQTAPAAARLAAALLLETYIDDEIDWRPFAPSRF